MTTHELNANDEAVLDALGRLRRPMSAYDILGVARSGRLKAPVQVYRALQKLEQRGLIHRIEALNAFVACSEDQHGSHRPSFVICRDCSAVHEFEDDRLPAIARDAAGEGFAIEQVSLEVYGCCAVCRDDGREV
jgi:Fur family zinc uptake transcriptional regulator